MVILLLIIYCIYKIYDNHVKEKEEERIRSMPKKSFEPHKSNKENPQDKNTKLKPPTQLH